jgi:N-acylglucosamine-6-phosphate 2-epimerase
MTARVGIELLAGRLIVSCQAHPGTPLDSPLMIAALAKSAELGGAGGVRVCGTAEIRAVRRAVDLPIIGLIKRRRPGVSVYITPTFDDALAVARAGADFVAVDATLRPRPDGAGLEDLLRRLRIDGIRVVADVDTVDAGAVAAAAGADAIATTLAGHTSPVASDGPDVELVRAIASSLDRPVLAEGRYSEPNEIRSAFEAGAYAVVVGTAITDPIALTARLVAATPGHAQGEVGQSDVERLDG